MWLFFLENENPKYDTKNVKKKIDNKFYWVEANIQSDIGYLDKYPSGYKVFWFYTWYWISGRIPEFQQEMQFCVVTTEVPDYESMKLLSSS